MFDSLIQGLTSTKFYLYGKKYCTSTGWEAASAKYTQPDILKSDSLSLNGKVFMISGANAGIGYEITNFLASKGGIIYMVCRNKQRGEESKEKIVNASGNHNIFVLECDCCLEKDIRKMWHEFSEHVPHHAGGLKLDALICNAGALSNTLTVTEEGIETTFAAHLLFGTYLLTTLAIPVLESTPNSRVVVVSSGGMYNSKFPEWEVACSAKGKYDGQFAYVYAKRGQVLLCEEWSRLHPTVKFVSCHPGWTDTGGVDKAYGESKKYLEPLRTLWQGAEGIIWLAVVDSIQLQGGEFYLDRSPQVKHMSGAFMTEGSFTKNTREEIDAMMFRLNQWSFAATRPSWTPGALNSPLQPLQKDIDIKRFMGTWYVIGTIPTFIDKNSTDNTEEYVWNEETQTVMISFKYVKEGQSAVSELKQKGKMANSHNTQWALSVKLGVYIPTPVPYLILDVDLDYYQWCIIGVPDRSMVWIMARNSSISDELYQQSINKVDNLGTDITKIVKITHLL